MSIKRTWRHGQLLCSPLGLQGVYAINKLDDHSRSVDVEQVAVAARETVIGDRFVVRYRGNSACADLFAIFYCESNGSVSFDLSRSQHALHRRSLPITGKRHGTAAPEAQPVEVD